MKLEEIAEQINLALASKGYKSAEACAKVWRKEVEPGKRLERIYLSGKKANGYIPEQNGRLEITDCNFELLYRIVCEVIS
jgi:hypothetical protein